MLKLKFFLRLISGIIFFASSVFVAQANLGNLDERTRFALSLEDASEATGFEVSNNLIAVVPENLQLIWSEDRKLVKVVSLMGRSSLAWYLRKAVCDDFNNLSAYSPRVTSQKIDFFLNENDFDYIKNSLENDAKANSSFGNPVSDEDLRPYTHSFRGYGVSWVTVVPEVANFSHRWKKSNPKAMIKDLRKRLNERLGLLPEHDVEKVCVEQWIRVEDLFRPSIDAESLDSSALPDNQHVRAVTSSNVLDEERLSVDQKSTYDDAKKWTSNFTSKRFLQWYDNEKSGKYTGKWAMPWSRLGYTYDYSSEAYNSILPARHFGFSEFCIRPQSKAEIVAIYSVDRYAEDEFFEKNMMEIRKAVEQEIKKHLSVMIDQQSSTKERINSYSALIKIVNDFSAQYPGHKGSIALSSYQNQIKQMKDLIRTELGGSETAEEQWVQAGSEELSDESRFRLKNVKLKKKVRTLKQKLKKARKKNEKK